eukprot:1162037-Pelagomonas_calceolata.AAC.3
MVVLAGGGCNAQQGVPGLLYPALLAAARTPKNLLQATREYETCTHPLRCTHAHIRLGTAVHLGTAAPGAAVGLGAVTQAAREGFCRLRMRSSASSAAQNDATAAAGSGCLRAPSTPGLDCGWFAEAGLAVGTVGSWQCLVNAFLPVAGAHQFVILEFEGHTHKFKSHTRASVALSQSKRQAAPKSTFLREGKGR